MEQALSLSLYDAAIPGYLRMLRNLSVKRNYGLIK